jgi:hypothetical protein
MPAMNRVLLALALLVAACRPSTDRGLFPAAAVEEVGPDELRVTSELAIHGTAIPPGTGVRFRPDGQIETMTLGADATIDGAAIPAGSTLHFYPVRLASNPPPVGLHIGELLISDVELGADAEYSGVALAAGDSVELARGGVAHRVALGSERTFGERSFGAGDHLWFENGDVIDVVTAEEVRAHNAWSSASVEKNNAAIEEDRKCRASCAGLEGHAATECVAGC